MPAQNSTFLKSQNIPELCGIARLPIPRSKIAISEPKNASELPEFRSIVDEAIYLFRANIFFKNFEIKGPADRTLLYALLFLQENLSQIAQMSANGKSRKEMEKVLLINASGTNFPIPGDSSFNLSSIFPNPKDRQEAEGLRQYLTELRVEMVHGLLDKLFSASSEGSIDKWWLSLSKRKFMNKSL